MCAYTWLCVCFVSKLMKVILHMDKHVWSFFFIYHSVMCVYVHRNMPLLAAANLGCLEFTAILAWGSLCLDK